MYYTQGKVSLFLSIELCHTKQPNYLSDVHSLPDAEGQGAVEAALLSESLKPKNFVSLATFVREAGRCLHR